jgi:hypothetical protein
MCSSKIAEVIHALELLVYSKGTCLLRNALGCADFPITSRGNFSPAILAATKTEMRSLECFHHGILTHKGKSAMRSQLPEESGLISVKYISR